MTSFAERFYSALENQLNEASLNGDSLADQYKTSIHLCKKAMDKLKKYITSYSFESKEDEIYFFKVLKPQFYSKYIFFVSIYKFIMQMPPGGEGIMKDYINYELADIKRFFDHNQTFYQYYRSGSTQADEIYFTRGGFDVHVDLEEFEEDEKFSTSHDFKLSKIMANEKYQDYLNFEMQRLLYHENPVNDETQETPLIWTANKTDLVELVYALVAVGVFNNGHAEIKTLVTRLQLVFQVDLGSSFYIKFNEITRRKGSRTVFIDRLKMALLTKLEEKLDPSNSTQQIMNFNEKISY